MTASKREPDGTSSYILRGGNDGAARLRILGAATRTTTQHLLARAGVAPGQRALDVGCGSGEVTVELARLVGPDGSVTGIDADPAVLAHARTRLAAAGERATFVCADVTRAYPPDVGRDHDVAYARFLLTHLRAPADALAEMCAATRAGGTIVVEDVDIPGHFCHPPSAAFARYVEIYQAVARRRGGDPAIGPRLPEMLLAAGLHDVRVEVVQPAFLDGDGKRVAQLTLAGIRDAAIETGVASAPEIDALLTQLDHERRAPGTLQSIARIVQAWGVRG